MAAMLLCCASVMSPGTLRVVRDCLRDRDLVWAGEGVGVGGVAAWVPTGERVWPPAGVGVEEGDKYPWYVDREDVGDGVGVPGCMPVIWASASARCDRSRP